jgi:hypothetical protein
MGKWWPEKEEEEEFPSTRQTSHRHIRGTYIDRDVWMDTHICCCYCCYCCCCYCTPTGYRGHGENKDQGGYDAAGNERGLNKQASEGKVNEQFALGLRLALATYIYTRPEGWPAFLEENFNINNNNYYIINYAAMT